MPSNKDRDKPEAIGSILSKLTKKSDLGRKLEQALIWERWPEVAGPQLCGHGRPVTIKDGTLYVEADSPVWMHKFAYRKWDLLKRANRLTGKELVSDVFFTLSDDDTSE